MSWSLRIHNGDLALIGTSFEVVTQEQKLAQDFRCFILERMGFDPAYPWYGSTLDGGKDEDGYEYPSVISLTDWPYAALQIEGDIRRMAGVYQQLQIARAKRDRNQFNKSTLTAGEILAGISSVDFAVAEDTLYVTIVLITGSGQQMDFTLATDQPLLAGE